MTRVWQWAACCLFGATLQIGPQWVTTQNGTYPVYSFPAGPGDQYPLTIVGPGVRQLEGVFEAQTPSPPRAQPEASTDGFGGSLVPLP